MNYRSRKRKKLKTNRLKFLIGLAWVRIFNKIIKKIKIKRRDKQVRLSQAKKAIDFLRQRGRSVRSNNMKINVWVDDYIERCLETGEPVNILTQWCISKDLEERLNRQGKVFVPTKKERKLFEAEMPQIIAVFLENGMRLNWWITFNRSYLDSGRIDGALENKYKAMITSLADSFSLSDNILFLDWEEEILSGRSLPDARIVNDFAKYISSGAFVLEFQRHSKWAKEEAGLTQSQEDLEKDVKFQIACEAEEGEFLTGDGSPFDRGEFILIPLEMPGRYDFFAVFAKDFKKRIAPVLPFYPWRLE